MKINIHRSEERGKADHGWLHTRFSFSFADYYNPERLGFGALRVLNDDIIDSGMGFDTHFHDNMEIITIVLGGKLKHRDSMGNEGIISAGEIQGMSAGTGIAHSEYNPSRKEKTHLLQVWVYPKEKNTSPSYGQKKFTEKEKKNKLLSVVSGNKNKKSLYINQDAEFLLGSIGKGKEVAYKQKNPKSGVFVFVINGGIKISAEILEKGDSMEITGAGTIKIRALKKSEILLIEVPMGNLFH